MTRDASWEARGFDVWKAQHLATRPSGSLRHQEGIGSWVRSGDIVLTVPVLPGWDVESRRRRAVRGGWAPPESNGELMLVDESADAATLKAPDNVHVSPRGSLILCEDSTLGAQYLRCLAPSGELFDLAQNAVPGLEHSEFAGPVFSGDGQTLFVNVYGPAMTIAIWAWGSLV